MKYWQPNNRDPAYPRTEEVENMTLPIHIIYVNTLPLQTPRDPIDSWLGQPSAVMPWQHKPARNAIHLFCPADPTSDLSFLTKLLNLIKLLNLFCPAYPTSD